MDLSFVLILILLLMLFYTIQQSHQTDKIRCHIRRLWAEHVMYTRMYITSYLSSNRDTEPLQKRLLKNQQQIGDFVNQVYGGRKGDKLTVLLIEHITGAVKILEALKTNATDLQAVVQAWYVNGDQITEYLAKSLNRNTGDLQKGMKEHLDLTIKESQEYFRGDYADSLKTFEQSLNQILHMADIFV